MATLAEAPPRPVGVSAATRVGRPALRLAVGATVLVLVLLRLGTGPVAEGLAATTPALVAAAVLAIAVSTACGAWRWRLVSRALGVDVPPLTAVAACYRSVFLNVTLPGGVVGDLHRGVAARRHAGGARMGLRTVAWERVLGQAAQVAVALALLLVLPTPLRRPALAVVLVGTAVLGCALLLSRASRAGAGRLGRVGRAIGRDLRQVAADRRTATGVVLLSVAAFAANAALLVLAIRATTTMPAATVVPVAVAVLLAATLPTSVAGWGPREGAAAWLFAAVGAGAEQGLAAAVLFGVLVTLGAVPGALALLAGSRREGRR